MWICLKCVKLRHNMPALSRINPILRGCNTQMTGPRLVWKLGWLCHNTFCLLNFFADGVAFRFSAFRIAGDLSLLATEKTGAANWVGSFPFRPSPTELLLGRYNVFVIPIFILNYYPLQEIDEESCTFIPKVTDQGGFWTIPSHPICTSAVPLFLTFAVKCVFVPLWKPDKRISWIGKWRVTSWAKYPFDGC